METKEITKEDAKKVLVNPVKKTLEIPLKFKLDEISPNKHIYDEKSLILAIKDYIENNGTFYDFRPFINEDVILGIDKFFEKYQKVAKTGKIVDVIQDGNVVKIKVDIDSYMYNDYSLPKEFNLMSEGEIVESKEIEGKKELYTKVYVNKVIYIYADDTKEMQEVFHKVIKKQVEEFNEKYGDEIKKANKKREKNKKKSEKKSKKKAKNKKKY